MGMFDKFLNVMRLNVDDDDDDFYLDDYDDDEGDDYESPKKKLFSSRSSAKEDSYEEESKAARTAAEPASKHSSKITPMSKAKRGVAAGMEVCVFKPKTVEDAREITETLLLNRTVLLNVEGLDIEIAQRIIDFTSGACFAIRGNLQKISNYIFVITPEEVDITGDYQNMIDSFNI